MGKHILGIVIFSFIFFSFVFVFEFFNMSIPQIGEIKVPSSVDDSSVGCHKKPRAISAKVISSQLFLDENKIVSKIKIGWENYSEPPERVKLKITFFNLRDRDRDVFGDMHTLENPFADSREKIITVVSQISENKKFSERENLYAFFDVYENVPTVKYEELNRDLAFAKQVLIIYGNQSITKK